VRGSTRKCNAITPGNKGEPGRTVRQLICQARLLDRLHSVVRWIGRYPVALKIGEHGNVYAGRDDAIDPPTDIPAIRRLYGVLFDALKAQIPHDVPGHDIIIDVGDREHVRVET
jgi:hypothetical protein